MYRRFKKVSQMKHAPIAEEKGDNPEEHEDTAPAQDHQTASVLVSTATSACDTTACGEAETKATPQGTQSHG